MVQPVQRPLITREIELLNRLEAQFLPYQLKYIRDKSILVGVSKAVRTGFTYAQSYKSFKKRAFGNPKRRIREIFASKNLRTAEEYLKYHRQWAEALNEIFRKDDGSAVNVIDIDSWTTQVCKYPGGDVEIYSSDPDAFRGLEGDVTLDEFAFHDQQDALYSSAQSRIQWLGEDGQLTLFSSHSHPETTFARLESEWQRGNSEFSWHRVTIEDAVREGLAFKNPGRHLNIWNDAVALGTLDRVRDRDAVNKAFLKFLRAKCLTEEDWLREYMCLPAAGGSLVKPEEYDKLINPETHPVKDHIPKWVNPQAELYIGIDIGRSKDLTVIWVAEHRQDKRNLQFPDCFVTVAVKTMRAATFPDQERVIREFLRDNRVQRCVIDQGTQGRVIADSMRDEFGFLVIPMGINQSNKATMCERVRQFVQQERISLPKDLMLRADILAMRREKSKNLKSDKLVYQGQIQGSHCDGFMGLALMLESAARCMRLDVAADVEEQTDKN